MKFSLLPRLALLLALSCFAVSAQAEDKKVDAAQLARIETYLNNVSSIVADFTQAAPDGTLTAGKFFLKRPGKMRWQYAPPTPVLIIANGSQLVYYDYELEQVSHLPIDSTLASFLARDKIEFSDPRIIIRELKASPGALRLTIAQADQPEAGTLTLMFSDPPLQLRTFEMVDAQGQTTTIALDNAQMGVELEEKFFQFQDPRKRKGNR